jgi:hypothetical protein
MLALSGELQALGGHICLPHEREHIGLRAIEHRGEFRELRAELIGDSCCHAS